MKNGRFDEDGHICWYKDGRLHREDGPAVEMLDGTKHWWVDGKRHRLDGPAVEWVDGTKQWFVNDRRHRLVGPAIEYPNGRKVWYVDGQEVNILAVFGYEPSVPLTEEQQMILRLAS